MSRATAALAMGLAAVLAGCGGSGYGSSSTPPVSCSGATPVALTVKNYLNWCSVAVAGQAPSTAAAQTVCVAAGPVAVAATALAGFVLGPAPWHGTVGDLGSGDAGTVTGAGQSASSAATVTAAGTASCAWICCPFTNGTGCPATNQCP